MPKDANGSFTFKQACVITESQQAKEVMKVLCKALGVKDADITVVKPSKPKKGKKK
jgi:hypothetical protein